MKRAASLALAAALFVVPVDAAGARHVKVVNLAGAGAYATFRQSGIVAEGPIFDRHDNTFVMPEGKTALWVSTKYCASQRLDLPTQPTVRVVVNTGCHLSIQ